MPGQGSDRGPDPAGPAHSVRSYCRFHSLTVEVEAHVRRETHRGGRLGTLSFLEHLRSWLFFRRAGHGHPHKDTSIHIDRGIAPHGSLRWFRIGAPCCPPSRRRRMSRVRIPSFRPLHPDRSILICPRTMWVPAGVFIGRWRSPRPIDDGLHHHHPRNASTHQSSSTRSLTPPTVLR